MPAIAHASHRAIQQRTQYRSLQRFFDVPERAGFDRRNHSFFAALARNDDCGNSLQFVAKLGEQIEPVHSGQFHVGNQNGGRKFTETRERIFRAAYAKYLVAPSTQQSFISNTCIFLILDDHDAVGGGPGSFKTGRISHLVFTSFPCFPGEAPHVEFTSRARLCQAEIANAAKSGVGATFPPNA